MPADAMQVFCCGCCTAIAGVGIATFIFAAYILYYILTTVFGCIIIYYGVALRKLLLSYDTFIDSSEGDYLLYSSLCISVGTMFTVVVLISVCSQRTNQHKYMFVTSIIQLAVLVIGIYSYFWAYPGTQGVEKYLSAGFDAALAKYDKTSAAWDDLQINLECCGKMNYTSWQHVHPSGYPPISCCREYARMETCSHDVSYTNAGRSAITTNVKGCMPAVQADMVGLMRTIQGILIPFLLVTLIGFFSTLCNAKAKKDDSTEERKVGGLYMNVPRITEKGEKGDEEAPAEPDADGEEAEEKIPETETKNEEEIPMQPVVVVKA